MSLFKNIVTLGKYDQLQQEEKDFKQLEKSFRTLESKFYDLTSDREEAFNLLQQEREEVVRNIALFKNLLSRVKKISKENKNCKDNDIVTQFDLSSFDLAHHDFSVDFQGKIDNVGMDILTSVDTSFIRLEQRYKNKKKISKEDVYTELGVVAIEGILSGISNIISLNAEVNEKRKQIQNASRQIAKAIWKIKDGAPLVNAESHRIIEIAKVLNKHNQIFSQKFESVMSELNLYPKSTMFYNFIFNKTIEPSDKMKENLHLLMLYASEYNKFNMKAKIS